MSENERTLPGGGIVDDHRTEEQKAQTVAFVVATDSFMSGWGKASGRSLFAVPVYRGQDAGIILDNMEHRTEMKRVRFVLRDYRPRLRDGDHLSISQGGEPWTIAGFFAASAARRRAEAMA